MYEIEVKVEGDHEPVRERLRELDAEPLGSVVQRDVYYDHPARSFAVTDEALRLRREIDAGDGSTTVVTYKGPLVETDSKTRQELESAVGDGEAVEAILEALSFDPVGTVEKERDRFEIDGFAVALDRVDGLGTFVEVEDEGPEEEIEPRREAAYDLLERLGLDPGDQIRTAYLSMLLSSDVGEDSTGG